MDIGEAFRSHLARPAAQAGSGILEVALTADEAAAGVNLTGEQDLIWSGAPTPLGPRGDWQWYSLPVLSLGVWRLWGEDQVHASTNAHPFPLGSFDVERIWGCTSDADYASVLRGLVPDNEWAVNYAFLDGWSISVSGWALRDLGAGAPRISLNGAPADVAWRLPSPTPAHSHWFTPGSDVCGFVAVGSIDAGAPFVRVDWVRDDEGPHNFTRPHVVGLGLAGELTFPEESRIRRVAGPEASHVTYMNEGLADTLSLTAIAQSHGVDPNDPEVRIMDWGCGCARMTQHLLALPDGPARTTGVDIDADNVNWCRQHLPGTFLTASLHPPLEEVATGSIDLVLSHSVLTHLTRDVAVEWLQEIARWLSPAGLAVLTYNGEASTVPIASRDRKYLADVLDRGIDDTLLSSDLSDVLEDGYYRVTLGRDSAWIPLFMREFEIVAIHPAATSGFQNAVVLRRKPVPVRL